MRSLSAPLRPYFVGVLLAVLPLLAAGCGIFGSDAQSRCDVQGCNVTLDNSVGATASVAGVDIELVKVDGDLVTLRVAGQELIVPKGDPQEAEAGTVSIVSITDDEIVVRVTVV